MYEVIPLKAYQISSWVGYLGIAKTFLIPIEEVLDRSQSDQWRDWHLSDLAIVSINEKAPEQVCGWVDSRETSPFRELLSPFCAKCRSSQRSSGASMTGITGLVQSSIPAPFSALPRRLLQTLRQRAHQGSSPSTNGRKLCTGEPSALSRVRP